IDGERINFFLNVISSTPSTSVSTTADGKVNVKITQKIFAKISDETAGNRELSYLPVLFLPEEVTLKAQEIFLENLKSLASFCKENKADIFDLDLTLYRFHNQLYGKIKDDMWNKVDFDFEVVVFGQKQ
ncbi:MAG: hypothetical protein MJ072_02235, partial [Clostridia bacterium]|nr:hypothetical protein [Clostridia bacterium]